MAAVADDTGLEVDALGGAPGVQTARYAGQDASYHENVAKLLEALRGRADRSARFATVAMARWPDGREIAALTVGGTLAAGGIDRWLAGRRVRAPATVRRPAHYLNPGVPDDRVALALGAGGARGLAQIGVIEAIQARGLRIDSVAGSSSGALVGGVFAAGKLAEFRAGIEALDRGAFLRLLSDPALGDGGLFHGHRLVAAMREVVGDPDIETLPVPFIAVAVDLRRQREVWLRSGPLWRALRASFAIPGL